MASSSDQPNGVWPITSLLYPGLQRRPARRVLGAPGRHQRRASGVEPGLVGALRRGPVVGDPGGRYGGGVVMQVGGRGQAVVFDGDLAAPLRAETLKQRDG